jgi:GNAT superfamily N-acetyltransferase
VSFSTAVFEGTYEVRVAEEADFEALRTFYTMQSGDLFLPDPDYPGSPGAIEAARKYAQSYVRPEGNRRFVFARVRATGDVVGVASMRMDVGGEERSFTHHEAYGEISSVLTHPLHRRNGVMRRILSDQIEFAKTLGLPKIKLEVNPWATGARALYISLGFQEFPHPGDPKLRCVLVLPR